MVLNNFDLNENLVHIDDDTIDLNDNVEAEIETFNNDEVGIERRRNFIEMVENSSTSVLNEIEGEGCSGEPKVGMIFNDGEDAAAFLYTYAFKTGFQWYIRSNMLKAEYRQQGVKRNRCGEKEPRFHMFQRLRLHCRKGGHSKVERESNNEGCSAYVECRIFERDTLMKITNCVLEHNHPTDPSNSRFMVSFRYISDYFKQRMMLNDAAGISIVNNYNSLVLEGGGHANLPFTSRDVRNAINLERRKGRIQGDASELESYFLKLKSCSPEFFYSIQRDSDGKLLNVFWADARCRAMCKEFGDAITYDTTFLCNRYHMPFSPFIGVNHHGNSVCLAAALISHEDADTFGWVFDRWMECMGKAPSVILSDQDKAIAKAIRTVFPNTPHRLCLWHMMRNGAKNLGARKEWRTIEIELKRIVNDIIDVAEFEASWKEWVDKYALHDNSWVRESFEIRSSWVPCYWRGTFCAGMSSTQRSEQQNRFFKSFVNAQTGLLTFIQQFEGALRAKVEEEKQNNFYCVDRPLRCLGETMIEEVFHKLYTNEKFKEVRDEAIGLMSTNVIQVVKVGTYAKFVASTKFKKPTEHWKNYDVSIDKANGEFSCSCKLFEFRGVLCRHIIRCTEIEGITFIPEKYILNRWRKDLVRDYETLKVGYYDPGESQRVKLAMELSIKNNYMSRLALQDEVAYAMCARATDEAIKELEAYSGIQKMDSFQMGQGVSSRVWGRRRLQTQGVNMRHVLRNTTPGASRLKDPVDKRGSGRAAKGGGQKTVRRKIALSQSTPTKNSPSIQCTPSRSSQVPPWTPLRSSQVSQFLPSRVIQPPQHTPSGSNQLDDEEYDLLGTTLL